MTLDPDAEATGTPASSGLRALLVLGLLALVAGVATGFLGGAFRWLLLQAGSLRDDLSTWAHTVPFGWLAVVAFGITGAALAAAIVRLSPRAEGSGIQDVEAVYRDQISLPPLTVIPARFVGGLASIGSGMVLGREGPTVHMGAALGIGVARAARLPDDDARTLSTAMSGAGLAVAFNAPVGGAIFVLEEVTKSASYRLIIPTVLGVGAAIACARLVIGDQPDFAVHGIPNPPLFTVPMFLAFGVLIGLAGSLYNALVVGLLRGGQRLTRIPPVVRAGVVGALIGALLYIDPLTVGGGDALAQMLLAGQAIALPVLLLYLTLRFVVGPLSYAAGTPGGLFAPILALGALAGTLFGQLVQVFAPDLGTDFVIAMAIVGMSTMFAAVVRAPLTGIVLIIEMTAITTVTVPMLLAAGAAVVVAMLVRSPPVYDSLRTSAPVGLEVGLTTWSAPNPFGEPTAFVLVHPITTADDGTLVEAVTGMGLKRLDADGDILPIGTEILYASLKAMRVELCTPVGVWLDQPVTDDWTGNAVGRRYIVLVVGTQPLADDADAEAISAYLADRESIFTALVKIRVRVENA